MFHVEAWKCVLGAGKRGYPLGPVHLGLYLTHLTKPVGEGQEMAHHASCSSQ